LVMEKVEFPPPTPARIRLVLYWILVYSGGHEQCRWCILGVRALPVGVAVSPGALAVRRSFIRQYTSVRAGPYGQVHTDKSIRAGPYGQVHTDRLWGVGSFAGRAC
jgi:hypothetical protein